MKSLVLFVIFALLFESSGLERRKRQWGANNRRHSNIAIDNQGNCRVYDRQFSGVCVRYEDCNAAVVGWTKQGITPVYCYYSPYEQYVCCPRASNAFNIFTTPLPPRTPVGPSQSTGASAALSPGFHANLSPNIFPQQLTLRSSDQECNANYLEKNHRRHHHRSRRKRETLMNLETNSTESNDQKETTEESVSMEPIIETFQKREHYQTEVVGGLATHRAEFPYMCALGWKASKSDNNRYKFHCGCVLVAKRYALTAAHCLSLNGEPPKAVRLGGDDLDSRRAEIIKIKQLIPHAAYNSDLTYNDIAIIKLERSSRKSPACIWSESAMPQQQLVALGYGQTQFAGPSSNALQKVFLNTVDNEECDKYYENVDMLRYGINPGQLCASDLQGRMDTCQGDSGGPLLLNVARNNVVVPYIVGLTSFGMACASGVPSVYTRLSYFLDWIEDEVFN